jgi:predicted porin
LSAFATAAQAQSSVTVYGIIDMGYGATDNTATTGAGVSTSVKQKNTGNGDGALATSRFGVRGVEDLGGGMKANFVLEYDLVDVGTGGNGNTSILKTSADSSTTLNRSVASADSVNGFGARYSYVGLEDAKLGQIRLGRQEQSIHSVVCGNSAASCNNVAGAAYSGGNTAMTNDSSVRAQNIWLNRAITYISPRINGVTLEVQTAKQDVDNAGTTTYAKETGGSLKYSVGKLSLAASFADTELQGSSTTVEKQKQQAFGANYDFGMARVFAMNQQRKVSDVDAGTLTSKTDVTEVGVQVPMGKTMLWASAFDAKRDGSNNDAITSSTTAAQNALRSGDGQGFQVGARYDLSKRTAVYGIYGEQELKATTGAASGAKIKSDALAFGVRHTF